MIDSKLYLEGGKYGRSEELMYKTQSNQWAGSLVKFKKDNRELSEQAH